MSPFDIELERKRKEKDSLAKKLEIAENEAAIDEMSNKIKFLENARKKSSIMPKDDVNYGSKNANQNTAKLSTSFLSSSSQKINLNQSAADSSTSNTLNNSKRDVSNNSKIDLQRKPIQLEGYRKICFDGILRFPNPIPQEMRKRFPMFSGNNSITCEDHLRNFLDMMSDYEVEAEDMNMKLFVQSLTKDAREWFKRLLELSIIGRKDIEYCFKEQYGDKKNPSYILSEFNNIKKLPNESIIDFNTRFQKRMYKLMQAMRVDDKICIITHLNSFDGKWHSNLGIRNLGL